MVAYRAECLSTGTDWSVNFGCGAMVDLDAYFSSLPPNSVTRFTRSRRSRVNKVSGEMDFGPMDAVFDAAARHNQFTIPCSHPRTAGVMTGCSNPRTGTPKSGRSRT